MARVLLVFYAPIIEYDITKIYCFYDSLAKTLADNGNNVKILNTLPFKKRVTDFTLKSKSNEKYISAEIIKFDPDVVISFNNQHFEALKDIVECPIVVYDADSIDMFPGVNHLKENIDRYKFFSVSQEWVNIYCDLGAQKKNVHYVPVATALKPQVVEQNKNISLIGTFFNRTENLKNAIKSNNSDRKFSSLFTSFFNKPEYNLERFLSRENKSDLNIENMDFWSLIDQRPIVLHSLIDLGLHIYGEGSNWEEIYRITPGIFACWHQEQKYSLEHNQEVYNSSKICLNINHPQANGETYSWRVLDIMATNGCLVSSPASSLKEQTKRYVDLPFYDNPWDARELCKKILKEDKLRSDIVAGSQEFIKDHGNINDRIKLMENILNIPLYNLGSSGKISFIKSLGDLRRLHKNHIFNLSAKITRNLRLLIRISSE